MAGRTHLQQALPVTFGYKVAIWLAMFDRHQERLAELRSRVLVVEFAGAAGTLASLGDKGFEVQSALADELRLGVPATTWHVARDAFAETVNLLALITGSLGQDRARRDDHGVDRVRRALRAVRQGARREQHDAAEAQPDLQRADAGAAKAVRQHAGLMVDAMIQDFERATGPWHAEWIALPESFIFTAGALHQAKFALGGLIVDTERMRHNLGISRGLIVAEAVMMGLARAVGASRRTTSSTTPAARQRAGGTLPKR
jgi:3-carboxy-cis,cis-muconate cycloisomerase